MPAERYGRVGFVLAAQPHPNPNPVARPGRAQSRASATAGKRPSMWLILRNFS